MYLNVHQQDSEAEHFAVVYCRYVSRVVCALQPKIYQLNSGQKFCLCHVGFGSMCCKQV